MHALWLSQLIWVQLGRQVAQLASLMRTGPVAVLQLLDVLRRLQREQDRVAPLGVIEWHSVSHKYEVYFANKIKYN